MELVVVVACLANIIPAKEGNIVVLAFWEVSRFVEGSPTWIFIAGGIHEVSVFVKKEKLMQCSLSWQLYHE
jgi:hypothetical protein